MINYQFNALKKESREEQIKRGKKKANNKIVNLNSTIEIISFNING